LTKDAEGFYWEIGNEKGIITDAETGLKAAGSIGSTYSRTKKLMIASASKWLYSTYAVEKLAQFSNSTNSWTFPREYTLYLNFTSGYNNMETSCPGGFSGTVGMCLSALNKDGIPQGALSPEAVGRFSYNGAHMAVLHGGGSTTTEGVMNGANDTGGDIASAIENTFATKDVIMNLTYSSALIEGAGYTSAQDYAAVLQGILRKNNPLTMHYFLKEPAQNPYAVCTNPYDPGCVDENGEPLAINSPAIPYKWHYSLGHWIESDPKTGDGAFSSTGAFGFYPWIDKTKTYYGVISTHASSGKISQACGADIRKAFMTGVPQI
jgi:hypothetical protein